MTCEEAKDCGTGADCIIRYQGQPKECFCVHHLRFPKEETGDCDFAETGPAESDHHQTGVIHHQQIKDVFFPNVTVHTANTEVIPNDMKLSLTVAPIVLFVILVITAVVCIVKRGRSLARKSDNSVSNGNGALLLDLMNTTSRNPTYFSAKEYLGSNTGSDIREVPMDQLKLLETVGEGAFGQVFKGYLYMPESDEYVHVAVKVLKETAGSEAYEDFQREVDIMASFNHDNILRLLGVVTQDSERSPFMIFEFMEHGDLNELLRRTDPHHPMKGAGKKRIDLTKEHLVDFSLQIAQGMAYLAGQRFVHRDLATRNCLVDSKMAVKISDFGMSHDVYNCDYYKINGTRMVPVRWLSPEAVKYGRFTTESDIWAYGVLLWEIFSYGKQPYYGHANEEVISFLDQGTLLQRPEASPSTIYHVMLGCWKHNPKQRVAFDTIVQYLNQYKNPSTNITIINELIPPSSSSSSSSLSSSSACGGNNSPTAEDSNEGKDKNNINNKDGGCLLTSAKDSNNAYYVQGVDKNSVLPPSSSIGLYKTMGGCLDENTYSTGSGPGDNDKNKNNKNNSNIRRANNSNNTHNEVNNSTDQNTLKSTSILLTTCHSNIMGSNGCNLQSYDHSNLTHSDHRQNNSHSSLTHSDHRQNNSHNSLKHSDHRQNNSHSNLTHSDLRQNNDNNNIAGNNIKMKDTATATITSTATATTKSKIHPNNSRGIPGLLVSKSCRDICNIASNSNSNSNPSTSFRAPNPNPFGGLKRPTGPSLMTSSFRCINLDNNSSSSSNIRSSCKSLKLERKAMLNNYTASNHAIHPSQSTNSIMAVAATPIIKRLRSTKQQQPPPPQQQQQQQQQLLQQPQQPLRVHLPSQPLVSSADAACLVSDKKKSTKPGISRKMSFSAGNLYTEFYK